MSIELMCAGFFAGWLTAYVIRKIEHHKFIKELEEFYKRVELQQKQIDELKERNT